MGPEVIGVGHGGQSIEGDAPEDEGRVEPEDGDDDDEVHRFLCLL